MKYRREIDGLRAVAVLPVILFHAGFGLFSGGYVGVDVFFVISGYLITSILISDLEQGNFSISRFYERRARRILPALFFVMLACLPFAYMWMLPSQLEDFAESIVAVVFFGSNILFWRESGYFADATELKPLLHTWSLAVEEQYYLVFPIFLLLVWRFGRNKVFWSVVVIAAMSLLLAEWAWRNAPSANFYLALTRAWELLAGSICAFITVGRNFKSNDALSAIGFVAIGFSIFVFDKNTPFPSVYALIPVVGTVLIILFGRHGTWVAKLLSMRAFVGIGLISYSAYLWHQPLFAFARLRSLTELSHVLMATLAVAALFLAWATWYWVEQPFRKREKPVLATQRSVFVASGAVGAIFATVGMIGFLSAGNIFRYSDEKMEEWGNLTDLRRPLGECISGFSQTELEICSFGEYTSQKYIIFIGDSHIAQWVDQLRILAEEKRLRIDVIAKSACALADVEYFYSAINQRYDACTVWRQNIIDYIKNSEAGVVVAQNSTAGYLNEGVSINEWRKGLDDFFGKVSDVETVFWIFDNPRFLFNALDCFEVVFFRDFNELLCSEEQVSAIRNDIRLAEIDVTSSFGNVHTINLDYFFCENSRCFGVRDGTPLMIDTNHISQAAAQSLIRDIYEAIVAR